MVFISKVQAAVAQRHNGDAALLCAASAAGESHWQIVDSAAIRTSFDSFLFLSGSRSSNLTVNRRLGLSIRLVSLKWVSYYSCSTNR